MWHVCRVFLLVILSTSLYADGGFHFPNHKKGFWITPKENPNNLVPLASGEKKTFVLNVCIKKWGESNKKERCQKVPDSKLDFKAYFPDKLHDVTDKILIKKSHDKKYWEITFQTDELKGSDLNQFSFIVGSVKSSAESLLKAQAKFEKKILELSKLKEKFMNREHKERYISYIDHMIALLTDVNHRIDLALEASPDVLAEISIPLQVDNNLAAPYYYSSNFSGQKMAIKVTHGSAIEGESVKLDASVTNLSHLDFKFPLLEDEEREDHEEDERDGNNDYNYLVEFNKQKIIDVRDIKLYFGETWTQSVTLDHLNPNKENDLSFIIAKEKRNHGHHRDPRKWGSLYSTIPVAPDSVAPIFTEVQPDLSIEYAQSFPAISATLSDSFGRIDPESMSFKGSATLINDTIIERDFTSMLVKNKIQDGQSYLLSSDINPLEEGLWTLTLKGADFAGNLADDVVRSIRIDRTAPIISLATNDNVLTNMVNFPIFANIEDTSSTITQIYQNGILIHTEFSGQLQLNAQLVEGHNQFQIVARDAAGNIAQTILSSIILDTIAPLLTISSPEENLVTNSEAISISGTANEPIKEITLNTTFLNLSPDKMGFTGTFSLSSFGEYDLIFSASDLAGNTATIARRVVRNSPPVAELLLPVKVEEKRKMLFDAHSSSDSDGTIVNYKIETGDGEVINSSLSTIEYTYNTSGTYSGTITVFDNNHATATKSFTMTVLPNNPPIALFTVNPSMGKAPLVVSLDASSSSDPDQDILQYSWQFSDGSIGTGSTLQHTFNEIGPQFAQLTVTDERGLSSVKKMDFTVESPNFPPVASMECSLNDSVLNCSSTSSDSDGTIAQTKWLVDNQEFLSTSFSYNFPSGGTYLLTLVVQDNTGAEGSAIQSFTIVKANSIAVLENLEQNISLPPDPAAIAPVVNQIKWSNTYALTSFLFSGSNPIQRNVASITIDPVRTCVVRGKFLDITGQPVAGVKVEIPNRTEFGYTYSRENGEFDFVVNGAENYNLHFTKPSFADSFQATECPFNDYLVLNDIKLIKRSDNAKIVNFNSEDSVTIKDDSTNVGLFIPANTSANIRKKDGSLVPLGSTNLRITPAIHDFLKETNELYLSSYEFQFDEEIIEEGTSVEFTYPIPIYLPNSSNLETGTIVNVKYFDKVKNSMLANDFNGITIELIGKENGSAILDTDGDGIAEDQSLLTAIGISSIELQNLSLQYNDGEKFIRFETVHFSGFETELHTGAAIDFTLHSDYPNLSCGRFRVVIVNSIGNIITYACQYGKSSPIPTPDPSISVPPPNPSFLGSNAFFELNADFQEANCQSGSIIDVQNQTLGENIPVAGVPFYLNYQSNKVEGSLERKQIRVGLTDGNLPSGLKEITLIVEIAGKRFEKVFSPSANLSYIYNWDGLDAYGRELVGAQKATIKIGYTYHNSYPSTVWTKLRDFNIQNDYYSINQKLGGWTPSIHHTYDPISNVLYKGNGTVVNSVDTNTSSVKDFLRFDYYNPAYTKIRFPPFPNDTTSEPMSLDEFKKFARYVGNFNNRYEILPDGSILLLFKQFPSVSGAFGTDSLSIFSSAIFKVGKDSIVTTIAVGFQHVNYYLKYVNQIETMGGVAQPDAIKDFFLNLQNEILYTNWKEIFKIENGLKIRNFPNIINSNLTNGSYSYTYINQNGIQQTLLFSPRKLHFLNDGKLLIEDSLGNLVKWNPEDTYSQIPEPILPMGLSSRSIAVDPKGFVYYTKYEGSEVLEFSPTFIYFSTGTTKIYRKNLKTGDEELYFGGGDKSGNNLNSLEYNTSTIIHKNGSIGDERSFTLGKITVDKYGNLVIYFTEDPNGYLNRNDVTKIVRIDSSGYMSNLFEYSRYSPLFQGQGLSFSDFTLTPENKILMLGFRNSTPRIVQVVPNTQFNLNDQEFLITSDDKSEGYVFNKDGLHTRTIDSLTGKKLYQFIYNDDNLLSSISDQDDQIILLVRDADKRVSTITSANGQSTSLNYNAENYLESVANPLGETYQLTYGQGGLLSSFAKPKGNTSYFTYDSIGKLERDTNPLGGYQEFLRADTGDGFSISSSNENNSSLLYDTKYLESGIRDQINTDRLGLKTTIRTFRSLEREVTYPFGTTLKRERVDIGLYSPIIPQIFKYQVKTPNGIGLSFDENLTIGFDEINTELIKTVTKEQTLNGKTYSSKIDFGNNQIVNRSPAGKESIDYLDDKSRVIASQISGILPVEYAYDDKGRIATVAQGERGASFTYSNLGYLSTSTTQGLTTTFETDAVGRVTKKILPNNYEIQFTYDANGNLTSITPTGKPAHNFFYNVLDFLSDYLPPELLGNSYSTRYSYSPSKKLTEIIRPDGKTVKYNYHPTTDQFLGFTTPDGDTIFSTNSTTGNVDSISAPNGNSISFTFDGHLPTSYISSGEVNSSVTQIFDNNFWLTSRSINDTYQINYSYDQDGLLNFAGQQTQVHNADNGLLTSANLVNVNESFNYSSYGEISNYSSSVGSTNLYSATYARDLAGRVTSINEALPSGSKLVEFSYDDLGQLIQVSENGTPISNYVFGPNGNRLSYNGITGTYKVLFTCNKFSKMKLSIDPLSASIQLGDLKDYSNFYRNVLNSSIAAFR